MCGRRSSWAASSACFRPLLGWFRPGLPSTRYIIAVAQMLMGALLIHLTGGRIETHFHVFGSLAFLAFYRDWRVLVPATVVVALDHLLRGIFWPQSVYGVVVASQWRWLEHAAWVVFEDIILVVACLRSVDEMKQTAERTATLEHEVRTRQQAENELGRHAERLAVLVEELRVTQRQAEAATRAKSDFLASMSHELRTPLNAIILYSELLQEEAEDQGNGGSVADLQRIQSAGKHLLDLINGILDLSKIEAGKMGLSLEHFDVKTMIDELVDTVAPLVQKNNNSLTVNCAGDVGKIYGDLMKTRQILLNLLSNASKFTKLGSITVDVRRRTIDGVPCVEFGVVDTGVGMTEAQTLKVFDAFTQADVTTTPEVRRHGAGARDRVAFLRADGRLRLGDEPSRRGIAVRGPAAGRSGRHRRRIDGRCGRRLRGTRRDDGDDTAGRRQRSRAATRWLAASSGAATRCSWPWMGSRPCRWGGRRSRISSSWTWACPIIDGWEATRQLKADAASRDIPIIVLSAHAMTNDRELALAAGGNEFDTKPVRFQQLLGKIESLLAKDAPVP